MPQQYLIVAAIVLNVLLLAGLIIWGPRLLRRLDNRTAEEATRLREMLLDVLSEQEAVTLRQAQIGVSITGMQKEIGKLAEAEPAAVHVSAEELAQAAGMPQLEVRIEALQGQLGSWLERYANVHAEQELRDAQSWSNLMGLLATMQDRIATLNQAVEQPQPVVAADHLLEELDNEMQNLRMLADEIAGLQWKLRRSVLERETSLAALRAQVVGSAPRFGHRAA